MKVYHDIAEFKPIKPSVVTTGTFDGVHLGHQRILKLLKESANTINGESVIFTFFPHPRLVLFPNSEQLLLSTQDEKIRLLSEAGIDHLVIHPFTREFSMLTSQEFIESILVQGLQTKKLVIGYDHHFGKDREGSFQNLKSNGPRFGFEVQEIPAWETDKIKVSSTRIRHALAEGKVDVANNLLGYRYMLKGTVVKGQQLGRKLGFPTANIISTEPNKLIPGNGVYAVSVIQNDREYHGMMNIGIRPTINGSNLTVEVNIFNFDSDIYGETIEVRFVKWVRGEQKFSGLEELKVQLANDKNSVLSIFKHEAIA